MNAVPETPVPVPMTPAEKRKRIAALRQKLDDTRNVTRVWRTRLKRAFNAYMKSVARSERLEREIAKLS